MAKIDCARCYWGDNCPDKGDSACEYYTPFEEDEIDEMNAAEYMSECVERQEAYLEMIAEEEG